MRGEIRGHSTSFDRSSVPGRRNGFALAAALLALLLIAALVTGVFFAATEETHVGAASAERQLTLSAAESAIELTIAGWSRESIGSIDIGVTRTAAVGELGVPVVVHITRLDSTLYWIIADATAPSNGSRVSRRIGVVVRVPARADHSITIDRISERSWSELF
ncbi:MAG TPA: hypothetical protein DGB72_04420 [Gemmatimonadetes bacterium]|jgi:hypothetical protein|nr:hypothetical protein [Gemmatimonadota bacterium]